MRTIDESLIIFLQINLKLDSLSTRRKISFLY